MIKSSRKRLLRALQIEVTTRCTRRCAICPRTSLVDLWREGDLSDALWRKLEPCLSLAEHVHLQGWGEPLLHPKLEKMVQAANRAGCSVGITTNGDLIDEAMDWILDEGIYLVTLSIAGEPETHERLRGGSRLERILELSGKLVSQASQLKSKKRRKIKIQLSYLLTRDNAAQLLAVVERAAGFGIGEIFVNHLDCTPTADLLKQCAFDKVGLLMGVAKHLDRAAAAAHRHGMRFRKPAEQTEEVLACALNPIQFAFVSWAGSVGPCVNQMLPVAGSLPRVDYAGHHFVKPIRFGELKDESLVEILNGQARMEFIAPFQKRFRAERQFISSISTGDGIRALHRLEQADELRTNLLEENTFPDACLGCHKKEGW